MHKASSMVELPHARSIHLSCYKELPKGSSTMDTIEKILAGIPIPKAKKAKKKKKTDEPEPVDPVTPVLAKKKKLTTVKKSDLPEYLPMIYGQPESIQDAISKTVSWQ